MDSAERPAIVTIMAVITIVWGTMGILMQIIMFITDPVTEVEMLLMGLFSLAVSLLALVAGAALGVNHIKGFPLLKMYIYAAFGFETIYLFFSLLKGISFSWTRLAIAFLIPAAMLLLIMKNEGIAEYRKSL